MENPIHLGDGAYVKFTGHDYVLTANDHRPEYATDTVTLDPRALRNLVAFAERCEATAKSEAP